MINYKIILEHFGEPFNIRKDFCLGVLILYYGDRNWTVVFWLFPLDDEAIFLPKLFYENYENIIDAVNVVEKIEIGNKW